MRIFQHPAEEDTNKMRIVTLFLMVLAISLITLSSCAPTNQEEYERVSNELSAVRSQLASLESKLAERDAEYDALSKRYETLESEYNKLKARYDAIQPHRSTEFPRVLTQEEQDRVREIALNSKEMVDLLKTRTIRSIELIWSGYPVSSGYWAYSDFEQGKLPVNAVANYPGIFVYFNESSPGLVIISVDLNAGTIVDFKLGGYEIPRKLPPP